MLNVEQEMYRFFEYLNENKLQIYNEISFQLELAIFLRTKFNDKDILLEKNVRNWGIKGTKKKEIDIVIIDKNTNEKIAIELKYPLNGQHPEQMYKFVEDACFCEQLQSTNEFAATYSVVLVNDSSFYQKKKTSGGIYKFFRENRELTGIIYKPTGKGKGIEFLELTHAHYINWLDCPYIHEDDNVIHKYYILKT